MIEKFFDMLPDWAKSKLLIRIVYTASSFVTARVIAFLTGNYLNTFASKVVSQAGHIGIVLQFKIVSVDQRVLEGFITGVLMVAAEFLIEHFHENVVLPAVAPAKQEAAAEAPKGASK